MKNESTGERPWGVGYGVKGPWLSAACVALLLIVCSTAWADEPTDETPQQNVTLNGETISLIWNDGDSFTFSGNSEDLVFAFSGDQPSRTEAYSMNGLELEGQGVRLMGFNTLESYGPVHQWGSWTAEELFGFANEATEFARLGEWHCNATGQTDYYGRLLISCNDLIIAMVTAGLAHVYCLDDACPDEHVEAQEGARADGRGMWEKGDPLGIITSVHSMSEYLDQPDRDGCYNRIIATTDGQSFGYRHADTYEVCEWWCMRVDTCDDVDDGVPCIPNAPANACMLYVPYVNRYGDERAPCLP